MKKPSAQVVACDERTPETPARATSARFLFWWVAIASLALRFTCFDFESGDYRWALGPWYDFFAKEGAWRGLGLREPHATYHPLYLYFISLCTLLPLPGLYAIKLVSVACDYVAAWYIWRLVKRLSGSEFQAWTVSAVFLFLPTTVMNGALWGQNDVMYTVCFIASLYYLLEGRWKAALVAFGIACALKPQAVFWCPLLAGLLASGRLPWKWIWIPPAVYVACSVPAILAGKPVFRVLWYLGQVDVTPGLTFGTTNWYQWVSSGNQQIFWWIGVVLTLAATAGFVVLVKRGRPSQLDESRWIISLAMLSVLFPPFLLPGMHERYFFPADVISLVYAAFIPGGWRVAALVQLASAFTYFPYLFNREPIPRALLSFAILSAIGLVFKELAQPVSRTQQKAGAE